ncbi:short-chain dehydrogenase [Actinoplanes sp. NBRC 14428]|uniref:Short-subunit dehydrogenase n=1 Tax=Pseudosporangium ferrugineum TaxID=439699 RepID=A0A2T0SEQ4_9ACTN|nr:SDR family NAD(P)-dependent oxidoreductase [Pseudosporangium ferrugineum]PRY31890.1 short-subunit dehydrogenase [Pseudosporangium ferrugineum]BCJ49874.1 short-chain dehydrogenase [Actinoplanes sp. NBRC 14428]
MSKIIVITGASDGIGAAAARLLHAEGHRVVIVGRSPARTAAVARELGADHFVADYERLADVRALAAALDGAYPRIDVLANNAGGVFGDRARTADGFEKTFQINHLAPFLLTRLLTGKLVTSRATVIQTSSAAARIAGKVVPDDLQHDRDFTPERAYGTTKLYNILMTTELHRRYHGRGLSAAAYYPGVVATSFALGSQSWLRHLYRLSRPLLASPDKGAAPLVRLAQGEPGRDWESGAYYEKGKVARRTNPQARDAALAAEVWRRTEELLDAAPR